MARKTPWGVAYYSQRGRFIMAETILATDYMDACDRAWRSLPSGAEDFHLIDDETELTLGPPGIRAAADAHMRTLCNHA